MKLCSKCGNQIVHDAGPVCLVCQHTGKGMHEQTATENLMMANLDAVYAALTAEQTHDALLEFQAARDWLRFRIRFPCHNRERPEECSRPPVYVDPSGVSPKGIEAGGREECPQNQKLNDQRNQMIQRLKQLVYIASDQTEHKTLSDCQKYELTILLGAGPHVDFVIDHQDEVIAILEESRRKRARTKPAKTREKKSKTEVAA